MALVEAARGRQGKLRLEGRQAQEQGLIEDPPQAFRFGQEVRLRCRRAIDPADAGAADFGCVGVAVPASDTGIDRRGVIGQCERFGGEGGT